MSILSTLAGALQEGSPGGTASPGALILTQVISMIQNRPGGLGGLLQSFQQGGLGHIFESWLGNGQNLPISPDQLRNVLGSDWVAKIAAATGLTPSQVEQHLSTVLPQVVDHLSPNGQMPQGDIGGALASLAQRFLHG